MLFAVSAMHAVESAQWERGKHTNPFEKKSLSLRSILDQYCIKDILQGLSPIVRILSILSIIGL